MLMSFAAVLRILARIGNAQGADQLIIYPAKASLPQTPEPERSNDQTVAWFDKYLK